ncbi:MAG TPA: DNA repair protein RadA, partial [Bacillota bacterium]|nr:DNA repair protein RadA [Bacillota bacterium]
MAGRKTIFCCANCGYEAPKWLGRCPGCEQWNTFEEIILTRSGKAKEKGAPTAAAPLEEIPLGDQERYPTGIGELDRVLGGGAVPGSVVLLGGDPGIGKSTLLLQAAASLTGAGPVLYASGEESLQQIKFRAERLRIGGGIHVLAATRTGVLLEVVQNFKPGVLVLDSVQAFYCEERDGVPGSVNQVREVAAEMVRLAKEEGILVFLVGHVTKEGVMAGPRLLEHMVDTVLYLEGERYHSFRILRGVKNRFGSTNEIGVFMMEERGMVEVANPSHLFITQRPQPVAGAVIAACMEGTRPLLVEIQSLVSATSYPSPRRTSSGLDLNRVALVMAVLDKYTGTSFLGLDTFVNAVGGVKLTETAADLALALSLVSSLRGKGLPNESAIIGEVGLTGEIRPVNRIEARLKEG